MGAGFYVLSLDVGRLRVEAEHQRRRTVQLTAVNAYQDEAIEYLARELGLLGQSTDE